LLERAAALPGRIDEQAAASLPCAFLLRHPFSFYFLASQFAKNAGKFAIKPWEGIVKNCLQVCGSAPSGIERRIDTLRVD